VFFSGFSVCPMAIEQSTLLAVRVIEDGRHIVVHNANESRYASHTYSIEHLLSIERKLSGAQWSDYVIAGVLGGAGSEKLPGMELYLDGNVPIGSGLSSSSSVVCAGGLAGRRAAGQTSSPAELGAAMQHVERW